MDQKLHPYYPQSADLQGFVPNTLDVLQILLYFFGGLVAVLPFLAFLSFTYSKTKLSISRKMILCWLLLCGCIHLFLEGHFAIYHLDIHTRMDFLSQVWKEYAKGDSRYLLQDPFTVCMETITAFLEGPGCFLTVWAFMRQKSYRYLIQLVVSLGQFYGCVLYFSTEAMEGFIHGPMWHPLYFWFYFVFMNVLWIIIPFCLIVDSSLTIMSAQVSVDNSGSRKRR